MQGETTVRCACPRYVTRRECIEIRYGAADDFDECECVCHDEQDAEDYEMGEAAS